MRTQADPDTKIFLIGNQVNSEESRMIPVEEGENLANELGLDLFMEASSKTGFNCEEILKKAAILLYKDHKKYKDEKSLPNKLEKLELKVIENKKKKIKSCF